MLAVPHVAQVSLHSRDTVLPIPYHLAYINSQGDKHPTITDTYTYLARKQVSKGKGHAVRDVVPHLQKVIQQGDKLDALHG
jgi:hypothetical protein